MLGPRRGLTNAIVTGLTPPAQTFADDRSSARREQALVALATAYAAWLEALVVQSPYDWFNFYEFWADDPVTVGRQGAQEA